MKMAVFGLLRHVVWEKFSDFSEVLAVSIISIALIMEAASTSETLVNFNQTTW
jgi:hypothetical protein